MFPMLQHPGPLRGLFGHRIVLSTSPAIEGRRETLRGVPQHRQARKITPLTRRAGPRVDTAKRFREETIFGSRLWAVEGAGSPRRYRLLGSGTIGRMRSKSRCGLKVHYRVDAPLKPIDVTDHSWFKRLRDEQRSFSYGLNKINDSRVIAALEALHGEGSAVAIDRNSAARKTNARVDTSSFRRSPSGAAEIVRQLVPQRHLRNALKVLAHSVRLADGASPAKWGLRLNRDNIMLKVGFVEVLQIGDDDFHLLLNKRSVPANLRADRHLRFGSSEYANAPRCGTCDMDIAIVARMYPALLPAHEEAIRVAAHGPRRADTAKDHSPGLVTFISQELGEPLPQPEYLEAFKNAAPMPWEIPADQKFQEGAPVQILLTRYERNPAARAQCIEHHGTKCAVCDVSLAERYGPETSRLIHVHHLKPLAKAGAGSNVNPVRDLRPVCPNCHAVIHLTDPPLSIKQVRAMLRKQGARHSTSPQRQTLGRNESQAASPDSTRR